MFVSCFFFYRIYHSIKNTRSISFVLTMEALQNQLLSKQQELDALPSPFAVTEIMKTINSNSSSDHNICQDFEHFRTLNVPDSTFDGDFMLLMLAVNMTIQSIKPSSALKYLHAISRMKKRQGDPLSGCHISDATKILHYLNSEEEASHARFSMSNQVIGCSRMRYVF